MPLSTTFTPGTCVNCDSSDVTWQSPLYCSPGCRQAAELVRYVRACRRDGRWERPDVKEAAQIKMALLLGGGYSEERKRVPADVRGEVFRRAGGRCQKCFRVFEIDGDAGPTIQHLNGDSNDISNLEGWCRACNNADAKAKFRPVVPGSEQAIVARQLEARWRAPTPIRLCDDDQRWKDLWRQFTKEAKIYLEDRGSIYDAYGDEDLPGFIGWTEQGTPIQEF